MKTTRKLKKKQKKEDEKSRKRLRKLAKTAVGVVMATTIFKILQNKIFTKQSAK